MRIVVHGGQPLNGTFRPSGNSNSAIALTAAALLTNEPVTLYGMPDTLSTAATLESAQALGVEVKRDGAVCHLQAGGLQTRFLAEEVTDGQVSAILFLAPILARRGHARIELPPPLSRYHTHLAALRDLGVDVQASGTVLDLHAERWESREITLLQASVTTTALVCMLAAVLGQDTTIRNAASEPHVQDLQHMLVAMGAQIGGIGSNLLHIRGSETLGGAEMTLSPDHIEVATVASIGAITHGSLQIEGVKPEHLRLIVRVLARLGMNLYLNGSTLLLPAQDGLMVSQADEDLDVPIETAPWPGFPSDLVAMTTVVASQARGMTLIHEKLFSNRLLFVDKLTAMGAQIVLCDPHRALVVGPSKLRGGYMDTPDVRTGLALLGAALCAQGTVTIDRAELIDRTFENVVSKLVALGAQIEVAQP
ncbi:UDP-N-acetylglucosamine 1-carboxyvinyltransferase [Aggregatilinea lenta]|uniref:UDP-N-acetylglucosamine 1-carboxyvinyltransferase n=1 Tax=Aggregatilinea lenta TaxID=913108 RepID=UPI000E5A20EA|nr:UDP-N-acetylglucosamine 1-carboxyvinyltransferase [Aggregatilinea lenta]